MPPVFCQQRIAAVSRLIRAGSRSTEFRRVAVDLCSFSLRASNTLSHTEGGSSTSIPVTTSIPYIRSERAMTMCIGASPFA